MKAGSVNNRNNRVSILSIFLFTIFIFSCVSIKPSTVQLSTQVGERITEMEKIHQLALQRYFDMEIVKVENFLTTTWEPLFLKNFLGTSQILQLLQNVSKIDDQGKKTLKEGIAFYLDDKSEADKAATELVTRITETRKGEDGVVRSVLSKFVENKKLDAAVVHISSILGTDEPARIIFDFTEAAHKEMQAQRKELLAPIEQARMEAIASLSEAYAELIRGQSTITGRLEAAAKRSKQQDELLDKLNIKVSEGLTNQITEISSSVNNALVIAQSLADDPKGTAPKEILTSFKKALLENALLKDSLNRKAEPKK